METCVKCKKNENEIPLLQMRFEAGKCSSAPSACRC